MFGTKAPPGDCAPQDIVSVRVLLRALGGLAGLSDGEGPTWSVEDVDRMLLTTIRVAITEWSAAAYGVVEPAARSAAQGQLRDWIDIFDTCRADFYQQNIMGSDYAVGAREQNIDAARRVLTLASATGGKTPVEPPQDRGWEHVHRFDTFGLFGPDHYRHERMWRDAMAQAAQGDGRRVRGGESLAFVPLWSDPAAAALETHLADSHWHRLGKKLGADLTAFLRERTAGALVLGDQPEAARDRMRRIAALPTAFWADRPAEDVFDNLNYCLHGGLDNPAWGEPRPSWQRLWREREQQRKLEQPTG